MGEWNRSTGARFAAGIREGSQGAGSRFDYGGEWELRGNSHRGPSDRLKSAIMYPGRCPGLRNGGPLGLGEAAWPVRIDDVKHQRTRMPEFFSGTEREVLGEVQRAEAFRGDTQGRGGGEV